MVVPPAMTANWPSVRSRSATSSPRIARNTRRATMTITLFTAGARRRPRTDLLAFSAALVTVAMP
jgi:hypothetical protein